MPFNYLSTARKSKRSQSALEYMMTYGWAILIIIIVAVILYSMGIFNPSSSITTTSIGFSPFTVSSTVCSPAGLSVAIIGGGLPDTATEATISKIYITSNTGTTALTKEYNLTKTTISPGTTATIIIPTVACTSAGVKYSISAKLQYSYSTPAGNVVTNTTGTIAGTSSSNPIVKYVPLTITSSAATPSPFQQRVTVNMNNYNPYASSNLSNIEFTYPNGTIIPSWRENGTTNTQTVVYWLKLGGFTTTTVDIDFFSTSSNVLNTVNTGEAPQLSCSNPSDTASCSTYAEYDDGANVFNYYQNFAGRTAPNGWVIKNAYSDTSSPVPVIDNSLDFPRYIPPGWSSYVEEYAFYTRNFTTPAVIDFLGNYSEMNGCGWFFDGWSSIKNGRIYRAYGTGMLNNNPDYEYGYSPPTANYVDAYNITPLTPVGTLSIFNNYDNITNISVSINYLTSSVIPALSSFNTISFRNGAGGSPTSTCGASIAYIQWVRVRAYPPNGVMPSVTFGSLA